MLRYLARQLPLILVSVLALSACQSKNGCLQNDTHCFASSNALLSSLFNKNSTPPPTLNPQFQYMRLTINGQVVWLAQGDDTDNQKVFFSADRSVFKWTNGRLTSVTLPTIDWRERTVPPFQWAGNLPYQFYREVDTTDGKIAVPEQRQLQRHPTPAHHAFYGDASQLIWLHEQTLATTPTLSDQPTFAGWYAFDSADMTEPVYGQQCISKEYCLSWQVWNPL